MNNQKERIDYEKLGRVHRGDNPFAKNSFLVIQKIELI
jgi:hypothetical protein